MHGPFSTSGNGARYDNPTDDHLKPCEPQAGVRLNQLAVPVEFPLAVESEKGEASL